MKLLNYTTTYFSIILLVLISVWAVIFYYAMFEEIYDSIDDGLDNRKMVLIARAQKDSTLLTKDLMDEYLYTIEPVDFKDYPSFKDTYKDTVMYMVNEEDYEPVRTLESIFKSGDRYYKIKLATSMVEEDDQIENLLFYTIILYAALVLSILLINNFFLRKAWKPFYNLMAQLRHYKLEAKQPIDYTPTQIEEFDFLNKSVKKLLEKTKASYENQKQFIENASHELQTPLSIAINNLEMLFDHDNLSEEQAHQLQGILENLERLTRLNRSLLLLSKIENEQFSESEKVAIEKLVRQVISNFSEMAAHKNLSIDFSVDQSPLIDINPDLAYILFSNLLKNAILYGQPGGTIEMKLSTRFFKISNPSIQGPLNDELLFQRFQKFGGNDQSTGLGLSIALSIAEQYGFSLKYSYDEGKHIFTLSWNR